MGIIVQKYGGKLVADKEKLEKVAKSIESTYNKGKKVVVVVSAQGDMTDRLNDKINELSKTPNKREVDVVLSAGEQITIGLLAILLEEHGYKAVSYCGWQAGIVTNDKHTEARIENLNNKVINKKLNEGYIVIVAGFQGVDSSNDITTLGRGGSDTTATYLAAALNAECCEIYKDTKSIYTADPKLVRTAKKLDNIGYKQMLELSNLGAKVLCNSSVEFAEKNKINLVIKSVEDDVVGTSINEKGCEQKYVIAGATKREYSEKLDMISFVINEKSEYKKKIMPEIEKILSENNIEKYTIEKSEEKISIILDKNISLDILRKSHDRLIIE